MLLASSPSEDHKTAGMGQEGGECMGRETWMSEFIGQAGVAAVINGQKGSGIMAKCCQHINRGSNALF